MEMENFYQTWLAQSDRSEKWIHDAPRVVKGKDLHWVQTPQDAKVALMIAPETGFPTAGSVLMKAEIPVGWHTGAHTHGEEAIYILEGEGFLLLEDRRYNFARGTVLHIPYRSRHQLFNTGDSPVVYLSGLAWPLEASLNIGSLKQIETAGANDGHRVAQMPAEESQYWPEDGRRISLHTDQYFKSPHSRHGETYYLMKETAGKDTAGFKSMTVSITSIFVDHPHSKSHSHSHLEAYLYGLEGNGYTEIDGKQYTWEQGDAVHVPPGMLHHQHFNPSDRVTKELRFFFGIRGWFEQQWKGYDTIHKELKASLLHT
jgi:uncharacterized cupin superfamily protein